MSIDNLEKFAVEFKALLDKKPEFNKILQDGRKMLSELVSQTDWFASNLTRLVLDKEFLASQWQSIDPNDIQIYFSPDKLFSVRAFIWEPGVTYPIHDHGSWGIVGAFINQVREKKYERTDDGTDTNIAQVKVISDATLSPGQTTYVLPENNGIHQMQAVNNQTAVSIHVYGPVVRKGYINYFNPHNNTAHRVYGPANLKKVLAIKTLGSIKEPWAEEVLTCAISIDNPEYIKNECKMSLDKQKG